MYITRLKCLREDSPKTALQLDDDWMLDYFLATKLNERQQKAITNAICKGGFFSESVMKFFQISKSQKKDIPKNYPELEI